MTTDLYRLKPNNHNYHRRSADPHDDSFFQRRYRGGYGESERLSRPRSRSPPPRFHSRPPPRRERSRSPYRFRSRSPPRRFRSRSPPRRFRSRSPHRYNPEKYAGKYCVERLWDEAERLEGRLRLKKIFITGMNHDVQRCMDSHYARITQAVHCTIKDRVKFDQDKSLHKPSCVEGGVNGFVPWFEHERSKFRSEEVFVAVSRPPCQASCKHWWPQYCRKDSKIKGFMALSELQRDPRFGVFDSKATMAAVFSRF